MPAAQKKWAEAKKLPFRLLSDPDHATHAAYGAWGEKMLYGKKSIGVIRTTVVINPDGTIGKIYTKVRVKGHVATVLENLGEL